MADQGRAGEPPEVTATTTTGDDGMDRVTITVDFAEPITDEDAQALGKAAAVAAFEYGPINDWTAARGTSGGTQIIVTGPVVHVISSRTPERRLALCICDVHQLVWSEGADWSVVDGDGGSCRTCSESAGRVDGPTRNGSRT